MGEQKFDFSSSLDIPSQSSKKGCNSSKNLITARTCANFNTGNVGRPLSAAAAGYPFKRSKDICKLHHSICKTTRAKIYPNPMMRYDSNTELQCISIVARGHVLFFSFLLTRTQSFQVFNFATRARRFMRETTREALRCKAARKTNPVPLNVACCRTWNRCRIERPFFKRIFVEFVPQFRRQTGKRWKFVTEAVSFKERTRSEYCTTVCNEHRQHPHHVQPPQLLACTTYSETVS